MRESYAQLCPDQMSKLSLQWCRPCCHCCRGLSSPLRWNGPSSSGVGTNGLACSGGMWRNGEC